MYATGIQRTGNAGIVVAEVVVVVAVAAAVLIVSLLLIHLFVLCQINVGFNPSCTDESCVVNSSDQSRQDELTRQKSRQR